MSFRDDTRLEPAGPGTFDVDVPGHWRVARGTVNGGYVAGLVTRALEAVVGDADRRPRSLTIHYPAACRPGPARVIVSVERSGGAMTTLSARVTQDDVTVALALAAFVVERPGLEFQHQPMPESPTPDQLEPWDFAGGGPAFASNWEYRPCVGARPFAISRGGLPPSRRQAEPAGTTPPAADQALSGGWIRPLRPQRLDAPLAAAMADAWIPPVITLLDEPRGMLPTIDLTVHFRASLPLARAQADDFSFVVFQSRVGSEGVWESDGVIWSSAGRVLAQARQLALFNLSRPVR